MRTFALLTALVAPPADTATPIPFDAITLERAEQLDGRGVTITFTAGSPAYTWGEGKALVTVCGPGEVDDVERVLVLRGDRPKVVDRSAKVKASGVRRVIRHPPVVVGGAG